MLAANANDDTDDDTLDSSAFNDWLNAVVDLEFLIFLRKFVTARLNIFAVLLLTQSMFLTNTVVHTKRKHLQSVK